MALIRKYLATVSELIKHNDTLFSVTFKSDKPFKFKPCQFLHLALDEYDPQGNWPESRCFSISSPTSKNCSEIVLTFSVVGRFTARMAEELTSGKQVYLKMPYGSFVEELDKEKETVFIAGGTGVTPFLSLFLDASFADFYKPKLYFGLRNKAFNIYPDLNQVKDINSDFEFEYVFEDESGVLNIKDIADSHGEVEYAISGPYKMIKTFKNYLYERFGDKVRVITDEWE